MGQERHWSSTYHRTEDGREQLGRWSNPKYRSRLVARQLKVKDTSGESFLSPTQPLDALRAVLSLSTTRSGNRRPIRDPQNHNRPQISIVDTAEAYINAKKGDDDVTYVELSMGDKGGGPRTRPHVPGADQLRHWTLPEGGAHS